MSRTCACCCATSTLAVTRSASTPATRATANPRPWAARSPRRAGCWKKGIDQPELGGRQHFLRWETPTTARLWDANGLDYDTTLRFADRPGFRCGTCREYPLYDLHQRRALRLRERPLIVMECSVIAERYLGLGYGDEALALMQGYRDTCHHFGGDFTLLWHNSHFSQEADRRFYEALVA